MRIPSGVTDQYVYFVAVDATDFTTRETGLATFTVYRSRNGAAAAAMTTPTINETDTTNMPGVYELLLDEDMTIDAGDQSQEMVFHITHAGMAPVSRVIELYRPSVTAGETLTVSSGVGSANAVQLSGDSAAADNAEAFFDGTGYAGTGNTIPTVTTVTNAVTANVTQISGDTTAADNAEAFFDGTGYAGTGNTIPTVTNVTNAVSANVTQISGDSTAADNLELSLDDTAGPVPWFGIMDQGTAQSATATELVLRAATPFSSDDAIVGAVLWAYGSTQGYWQSRIVNAYTTATDTATVDTWDVTPSGTITYKLFGSAAASSSSPIPVNVVQISGDATAANNAESFFDGTGYAGTNNVIPTVTTVNGLAANTVTASALATDAVNEIVDQVWREAIADHSGTAGSTAEQLAAAGAAGDPWATAVPGAYGAGTAGNVLGNNLNATVSSRATQTSVDTIDDLLDTEMPALTTAVADLPTNAELATALGTADDAVLAAIAALNNISVANVLAATVEGSTTLVQTLRLLNSALGGKASGLDTTTAVYRDIGDTKDRITATVDADGNRSAVTLDLT